MTAKWKMVIVKFTLKITYSADICDEICKYSQLPYKTTNENNHSICDGAPVTLKAFMDMAVPWQLRPKQSNGGGTSRTAFVAFKRAYFNFFF